MTDHAEAEKHFQAGSNFYRQGNYIEASKEYQKAIEKDPNYVDAYNDWGNALYALKKYDEAIEKYQKAVEINPNFAIAYFNWGNALADLKRYEESIERYQKATEINPNYVDAYFNWGLALAALKQYEEAIEKYQKAIEKDPNYVDAYSSWGLALAALKQYEEAIEKYQKAIEIDSNYFAAYNNWGNALSALKKYNEAIEKYQKAIEIDSNYVYAYNGWGCVLHDLKRYREAIEKYQKAIEIDSNYDDAYYDWGNTLYALKRYGEAMEKYQKAIEINSDYVFAYLNLGNTLADLKLYDEAIEKFQKTIEKDSNHPYAYHNVAHYLWWQGKYKKAREEWDKARRVYEQTMEKDKISQTSDFFSYYGGVLHEIFGELDEAEKVYKEGLKFEPDHVGILIGLVDLYLEKKDEDTEKRTIAYWESWNAYKKGVAILKEHIKKTEDASYFLQLGKLQLAMDEYLTEEECKEMEKNLLSALEKDKDSADPYINLGVMYTYQEDYKKAIQYFQAAFLREPDNLTVRNNLAETYLKMKQVEKAESGYKKILEITSGHIESQIGLGEVYTAMGDAGDGDMYDQAIPYFTEAIKLAKLKNGSKRLKKKELAAVLYSRGYARIKLYETSKIIKNESLLHDALNDFKEVVKNDPDHHKARRAKEKLENRLSRFSSQKFSEKIGPWLIIVLSLLVFIFTQSSFFFDKPKKCIEGIGYYSILSFGSLIFMVVGLYLPQILKLKVGAIELEKSAVEQITTPSSLGISR